MLKKRILVFAWVLFSFWKAEAQQKSPLDCVDPNIGSAHSRWFFYTPAANPFGMAKPAPSTNGHEGNQWGWEAVGYDDRHTSIEGFANFHEFQVGGVVLMPSTGKLQTVPGEKDQPESGYRSRFDKPDEKAEPGYYQVLLKDYQIKAELTSTPRVAFHRYTYPATSEAHLLFDIGNQQGESGKVLDAFVRLTNERELEGFVITHPEYVKNYQPGAQVKMYFVAELSKKPEAYGAFYGEVQEKGKNTAIGPGAGMYLHFSMKEQEALEVKVGLSYTSVAHARLNLKTEAEGLDFDQAREKAQAVWQKQLGKIQVSGGLEEDKVKFYTGLYHALLGRGLTSDVNGAYPKNNGGIGQIPLNGKGQPEYHHYNTDAVWGAFWNLTQLWALVYPRYFSEFVRCQLDQYKDAGWLPDGIAASKYVSGVGTNFMGQVVSSAYLRGIRDFDAELAYEAVKKNEIGWMNRPEGVGKADTKVFMEKGYVPYKEIKTYYSGSNASGSQFSASHTLEYSFSAYAAAQFAEALNKKEDMRQLTELAKGWQKLFDEQSGFIRPKDENGKFLEGFDPSEVWKGFQEGNSWQYTFYVPHDVNGLVERIGKETFNQRLDQLFEQAQTTLFGGGKEISAFSGLKNVYNHGNQPSLHISYLFNYSGKPWLSQKWVREICRTFYGTDGQHGYGYGQDEDQGQLGAWFVLAGMGLFDVQGGSSLEPTLQLTTPLFNEVRIQLDAMYYPGKEFIIEVDKGDAAKHGYIQSARWKGKPLQNCWLPYAEVVSGGTLELKLSKKPGEQWGVEQAPPSMSKPLLEKQ
ncbi:GH92 family glycosyl hydrolase [Rapidithrix thailandica]|uniref:GH92 family glycosyl hydrolase n=1 Tax=Rapidithrix thailandica TaxID=413964 RepID=A0AAW9S1W7_9BACT